MGFRDMRLRHKALPAGQAWRLIQYLDSLCAQLLMVKYYPNAELVDTVFSGAASPTWKSIVYGLELLKEGTNMERREWDIQLLRTILHPHDV
jgi:hypothetical protein